MPEHEAQVWAVYDHETEEPRATGRRRRQVADWGVGEDVFDRLPSRRFARADRRGADTREHRHEPRAHREVADWDDAPRPPRAVAGREDVPRPRREVADWGDAAGPERFAEPEAPRARRDEEAVASRRERRPAADWLAEVSPRPAPEPAEDSGARADADGQRTIVLGGAVEGELAPEAPKPRRTIVIGGHPDKLPAPRPRRPPRTAVERLGASPDRIMGYAVALGLLLILIAVLTTSH
jgi:hypothetical protein